MTWNNQNHCHQNVTPGTTVKLLWCEFSWSYIKVLIYGGTETYSAKVPPFYTGWLQEIMKKRSIAFYRRAFFHCEIYVIFFTNIPHICTGGGQK